MPVSQFSCRPGTARTPLAERRRWTALCVLAMVVLLISIDNTVLSLAIPALTAALAPTAEQVLWIGDIYSLVLAGLLVMMGNLADRFGRKRVLLLGSVSFGAVSLIAAFSTSAEMLILARALLGVAAATLMPSTLSLLRHIFPEPAQRTRAIAIWSTAFAVGSAIGPLIGGLLLEHFWWGSVFLINAPVMIAVVILGWLLLPESRDPEPGRFDYPSALLSLLTTAPLIYAISHSISTGITWQAAGCLLLGLGAGVAFVRRQRRIAHPMLEIELFTNPAFAGAVAANTIAFFALSGLLFFFSQYLQFARGYSPLQAGLFELPTTVGSIAVVAVVGVLLARLGRGRAITTGLALGAAGLGLIALAEAAESFIWLALCLGLVGFGIGLATTLTGDAILSAAPPHKAGAVSAVTETANELGVALGVALLGSILTRSYRLRLEPNLPDDLAPGLAAKLTDSLGSALSVLDPTSSLAETARQAFTAAMQTTTAVAAVATGLAAIVAWRLIPSPLPGGGAAQQH